MRLRLTLDGAGFSDGGLASLQRLLADMPLSEPAPKLRESNGRLRRGTVVAIFDAEKVRRVLRARSLDAFALAERLHMGRLPVIFDYGEVRLDVAERVAKTVGVPLAELILGTKVVPYGGTR